MCAGSGAARGVPSNVTVTLSGCGATALSHASAAARPVPPLPGSSASAASAARCGKFTRWRARDGLVAAAVSRDGVEVVRGRKRAEVDEQTPTGARRKATGSPSRRSSTEAVSAATLNAIVRGPTTIPRRSVRNVSMEARRQCTIFGRGGRLDGSDGRPGSRARDTHSRGGVGPRAVAGSRRGRGDAPLRLLQRLEPNLNDALIAAGTARRFGKPELFQSGGEAECFGKLPSSARAAWNAAASWYRRSSRRAVPTTTSGT